MKTLDRSRDFGVVTGQSAHKYEQDNKRFDADGVCMDEAGYKSAKAEPARDTRTTAEADPKILDQIARQTGDGNTELDTLGLSDAVMANLRAAEINSVEVLCRRTEYELVDLPKIGGREVDAIKKALKAAGKKLAG